MMQLAMTLSLPGPSLSRMLPSSARAVPANSSRLISRVFMAFSSHDLDREPLHHVVVIAGRVVDQLEGLGGTDPVARLGHDRHRAYLVGPELDAELAE